jgi:hypothetical protein
LTENTQLVVGIGMEQAAYITLTGLNHNENAYMEIEHGSTIRILTCERSVGIQKDTPIAHHDTNISFDVVRTKVERWKSSTPIVGLKNRCIHFRDEMHQVIINNRKNVEVVRPLCTLRKVLLLTRYTDSKETLSKEMAILFHGYRKTL